MNTEGDNNKGWTQCTNHRPHPIVTPEVKTTHFANNHYHSLQEDDDESITNLQIVALDNNDQISNNNKVKHIDIEEEHDCGFLEDSIYKGDRYKKSVPDSLNTRGTTTKHN